jgi:hypothetical protein
MRIAFVAGVLLCLLTSPVSAQINEWAEAEALYFGRLSGDSVPLVSGPGGFSTARNSGAHTGYRIAIGGAIGDFEVEAALINIENLSGSSSGTIAGGLSLDGQSVVGVPFPNQLAFNNALFNAANFQGTGNNDGEQIEAEFLQPGATYELNSWTDFRSGEINFGTNRTLRPWRLGVGYRTMILKDGASSLIAGTFDALDTNDGATVGSVLNDANDGLSHLALVNSGFTTAFGDPDGYDAAAIGPDTLRIYSLGQARNELHGAQLTGAYSVFPLEWLTLEFFGKAGLYYNTVQSSVLESLGGSVNDNSVYQRTFSAKDRAASFVGSLGVRTLLPITDYISITLGYEAILMGNVALGPEQFTGVQTNALGQLGYHADVGNSLVLHGGNLGLQITW